MLLGIVLLSTPYTYTLVFVFATSKSSSGGGGSSGGSGGDGSSGDGGDGGDKSPKQKSADKAVGNLMQRISKLKRTDN